MARRIAYKTQGTCCKTIEVEIDERGLLREVKFIGGCDGNLQGICSLVKGMDAKEVTKRLKGIRCGSKATSCPDQLSKAIETILTT